MYPRKNSPIRTITWLLIVGGMLAFAIGGYLNPVLQAAAQPVIEAQTWLATRYVVLVEFFTTPRDATTLRLQAQALETENARLRAQVIEFQQQGAIIEQLSALLDFARANPNYEYIATTVIGRDPSPFLDYVIINVGSDEGILRGMPVVTDQGLVGRVAAVNAGAARVELITNADTIVNVRLQNSREDAVLQGSITGDISLNMIPLDLEIQPGEMVLTSGLGGAFPPNILIGQVVSVRSRSFDLFQIASVQPLVDFSQLDIVLVIRNFRPVDVTPLIPAP